MTIIKTKNRLGEDCYGIMRGWELLITVRTLETAVFLLGDAE